MNGRASEELLLQFQKRLLPSIPLWSCLLVGDLSWHGTNEVYDNYKPPTVSFPSVYRSILTPAKGTSTVEGRFHIVKKLDFAGKKNNRVDDFVRQLEKNVDTIYRQVSLTYLQQANKLKKVHQKIKKPEYKLA